MQRRKWDSKTARPSKVQVVIRGLKGRTVAGQGGVPTIYRSAG